MDYTIKKKGDQFKLSNKGNLEIPVEITFFDKGKNIISSKWLEGFTGDKIIAQPKDAVSAVLDYNNLLPDLNKSNNSTKHSLGVDFIFDEPDYNKHTLYLVPLLFHLNEYNGWTPGLMTYSGYIPTFDYGISVKLMWDFKNNRLVGGAQIQKKFFQKFGFRQFNLTAAYSDYEGHKGSKLSFLVFCANRLFPIHVPM